MVEKKIGIWMSILMGVTMSFGLSLSGTLLSGHFTVQGFLLSFLSSTLISLLIGFIVPMKRIGDAAVKKAGISPRSLGAHLLTSLISNIIYTPFITLAMTFNAYMSAKMQGAQIPFLPMYLRSFVISFIIAYVLLLVFTPIFMKLLFAAFKVKGPMGGPQGGPQGGPRGEH